MIVIMYLLRDSFQRGPSVSARSGKTSNTRAMRNAMLGMFRITQLLCLLCLVRRTCDVWVFQSFVGFDFTCSNSNSNSLLYSRAYPNPGGNPLNPGIFWGSKGFLGSRCPEGCGAQKGVGDAQKGARGAQKGAKDSGFIWAAPNDV